VAGPTTADGDLARGLQAWLGEPSVAPALARPVSVVGVTRLSGGASRQSYAVDLDAAGAAVPVVVQRKRPGGLGAAMADEASLVAAAGDAGVPVAPVLAATNDPAWVGGQAMVVARVAGESVARVILRDDAFATARRQLVNQAAAALAAVARIDPGPLGFLRDDDPVALLSALHAGLGRAQPVFDLAFRWLADHRPDPVANPVVVHGDYRLGNLIVDATGLRAVIDWELAHLGDPAEDLAWACVKAWRFAGPGVALGLGGIDEWVDAYVAAGGQRPDPGRLRWWLVCGTLRWGVICELQAAAHLTGAVDSVELAVLGRRVAETEHDLLGLLGIDVPATPPQAATQAPTQAATQAANRSAPQAGAGARSVAASDGAPHDPPDVDALLAAVEGYLSTSVVDATTGQVRFHARVAANAVAMVRRQVADHGQAAASHRAGLSTLGVAVVTARQVAPGSPPVGGRGR
jgi:aminoglycoside phosphotransferase (APT) family kinase protein